MCGKGAIAQRTASDWYVKFYNGNVDLKDAPRSEKLLNQLLHDNSSQTTRKLTEKMECSHYYREKSSLDRKDSEVTITTIKEPQLPLVCFLITAQLMDTSNDLFTENGVMRSNARNDLALINKRYKIFILVKRECIINYELLERNQRVNAELYVQYIEHGYSRENT